MHRFRKPVLLALVLLGAHVLVIRLVGVRPAGPVLSDLIQLSLGLIATITSFRAASRSGSFGKAFWRLAGSGFLVWCVGQTVGTYYGSVLNLTTQRMWAIDVFYNTWTAPLLMCLFLDPEADSEGLDWARILDFTQIGIFVILVYLYYSNLAARSESLGDWRLALIMDGLATTGFFVRAMSGRTDPARVLFRRIGYFRLVAFLTDLYFVSGLPEPLNAEWFDLVWSLPWVIPIVAAVSWDESERSAWTSRSRSHSRLRMLITQLLPLLFPLLVLVTAAQVARGQLKIAASAVFVSLGISYARLLYTQKEQQRSADALRKTHGLLQAVIEGTSDAIFVKDLSGRYVMINAAGAKLLGAAVQDVIGKDDREFFSKETARLIMEGDRQVMQSGANQTYEEVGTAAGVTRTYLSTKAPHRDWKGNTIGLVGISVDITERKRLEEQLRQAQKMEAIGTLSGGIAHDFNNLLTVIKGYCQLVLDRVQDDPELRSQVEQIEESAERAATLTRQLLAFSRRQVLKPRAFNINSLVGNLEKMLRRLIGEDIEMLTVMAPDLGRAKADPGQIEQVVMNLVVNARDAMPKGGKLTLETANVDLDESYSATHADVTPGPYVMLAVSDTGSGMDAEKQVHVFEPFYTTKKIGEGTGLGLSMVFGIVKQSGGSIGVYSEPGRGTTFKVYLPRVDDPSIEIPSAEQAASIIRGTETILLVEDDRAVRELAHTALAACGYSVLVGDSLTAVSQCDNHPGPIHLLLTDVIMPGRSGGELAKLVVEHRPEIKVLYMSGYTNDAIVHHGVLDTGTFFLQKPFTPITLSNKVREVLDSPNTLPRPDQKN